MSNAEDFLDPEEKAVMPEDRVEVIEGQLKMIQEACAVIQMNVAELEESGANIDDGFLNRLWVWSGKTSIGTYDYIDEDGIKEESGW